MANTAKYAKFMFQLSDLGCSLQVPKLRDTARTLLKLMPAGKPSHVTEHCCKIRP